MRLVGMKEFYNSIKLGDYFFKLTSKNPKEIVEAFLKKPYKTYIDSRTFTGKQANESLIYQFM
jgi:hypothetical protein